MSDYQLVERLPTVAEFCDLRRLSGLTPKTEEAAAAGLPNTLYSVVVEHGDETVGMGRIIGDGGTVYQIADMAVLPAHQGKGQGKRIMQALVGWLQANAPKSAYVNLIADGEAKNLYAQFGFAPTAPASIGMSMWIR
ncbi:MAG: GNAT family N-acetyltransferase [Devosia sp.]